jgi:selenide,water dikinase
MGGRPLTALSIVGFPIRTVADEVLHEILRGGIDKMAEAGVAVIGGHSIKDNEIKAGFAVTGVVDPSRITLRAGARPGDVLILTKPLGTGIVAFAAQIDRASPEAVEAAARSMTALNKIASELMLEFGAHGCTDVTGFGLIGHLAEMAAGGRVNVEIVWDDLPLLPGVLELVGQGVIPGGVERNRESSAAAVTLGKRVDPAMLDVCLGPETSGGLLIAVARSKAAALLRRLHKSGIAQAAVVGRVRGSGSGRIFLQTRGRRPIVASGEPGEEPADSASAAQPSPGREPEASACPSQGDADMTKHRATRKPAAGPCCGPAETPAPGRTVSRAMAAGPCCPEGHGAAETAAGVSGIRQKFAEFMKAAASPGALDAPTKQAVAVALSVLARCGPCARNHIAKARKMGFSQDEIDEAAWMAIAFGGSTVMMFYEGVRQEG